MAYSEILELVSDVGSLFYSFIGAVFAWYACSFFLARMNEWRVQNDKRPFTSSECSCIKFLAACFFINLVLS